MIKDLAPSERAAEKAKAEHAELVEQLQEKRVRWNADRLEPWRDGPKFSQPVPGDFTPQTAGLAVQHDGIMLRGGPFGGIETKVPRGLSSYERPAAGQTGFVPARYRRTKERTEDGLAVFQYQEPVSVSASA